MLIIFIGNLYRANHQYNWNLNIWQKQTSKYSAVYLKGNIHYDVLGLVHPSTLTSNSLDLLSTTDLNEYIVQNGTYFYLRVYSFGFCYRFLCWYIHFWRENTIYSSLIFINIDWISMWVLAVYDIDKQIPVMRLACLGE